MFQKIKGNRCHRSAPGGIAPLSKNHFSGKEKQAVGEANG